MRNVSLLLVLILFSGCAFFKLSEKDPDFNKSLIAIPQPPEERVWVEAKTSKVWVNPHVDENGDFVEGHYKHVVLEPGHWVVNGSQGNKT